MTPAHLVDAAGGGLVQAVGPPDLVTQPQCVEAPHLWGVVRTVSHCRVSGAMAIFLGVICCTRAYFVKQN